MNEKNLLKKQIPPNPLFNKIYELMNLFYDQKNCYLDNRVAIFYSFKSVFSFLLLLIGLLGFSTEAMATSSLEEEILTSKKLTIKNNGSCAAKIYRWKSTGDVYYTTIHPGRSWTTTTYRGHMWRAVNTNQDWRNLKFDKHYTVGYNSYQNWSISPSYCAAACVAKLEHFSAIDESSCGAKNGKILHDPHIDVGTKLPYYVQYTFNGNTKKHGPYYNNQDYYIKNLAPGTYQNLTIIGANGCKTNHGNLTIRAAHCACSDADSDGVCDQDDCKPNNANFPGTPGAPCNDGNPNTTGDKISGDGCSCAGVIIQPTCNLDVDAGKDQVICEGQSTTITAYHSGANDCSTTVTQACSLGGGSVIASWNMSACASFSGNRSSYDFSELSAKTTALTCAGVSAVGLYTSSDVKHSCTNDAITGAKGDAVCVGMPNIGSFKNNHPNAVKFDITIDPSCGVNGITKLEFREMAPTHYIWSQSGYESSTGKNNYPRKYGMRVLKNGTEIYKRVDIGTTTSWSKELFDFNGNMAFQSTTKATYTFELLAYSLAGVYSNVSAWDLDEIKVYGTSCTPTTTTTTNKAVTYKWSNGATTPSIMVEHPGTYNVTVTDCKGCTATDRVVIQEAKAEGGQIAVGTCNNGMVMINNVVAPNNPTGEPLEIVWIKSQGQFSACELLGELGAGNTNVGAAYDAFVTAGGFAGGADPSIPNTTNWMFVTDNDGDDLKLTVTNSPKACYLRCVRVIGCERFTGETDPVSTSDCFTACADADNDGICDVDDCQPNNANFPGTPGAACNDGNANTENDKYSADGCSCAGTPIVIDPCANKGGDANGNGICDDDEVTPPSGDPCAATVITPGNGEIKISGLDGSPIISLQVFTKSWQTVHNCWDNACDKPMSTIATGEGTFLVFVKYYDANYQLICKVEETVTVGGTAPVDPCANKGGDANGNGICDDDEVAPPVDPCANKGGDANGNGICDDDEVAPPSGDPCTATVITPGNGDIKISGLDGSPIIAIQVFTKSWQTVHNCWDNACDKPMSTIVTGEGVFLVFVKYYDASYKLICQVEETITVGGSDPVDPCANKGGDSNGNGICDDDEVAPPVDPCANKGGDSNGNGVCDDDEVTPPSTGGCDIGMTHSGNSMTITGLDHPVVSVLLFDWNWKRVYTCDPWSSRCGSTQRIDNLPAGKYRLKVETYDASWKPMCKMEKEVDMGNFTSTTSNRITNTIDLNTMLTEKDATKQSIANNVERTTISGINKANQSANNLTIYPNPANNVLNVTLNQYANQRGQLQLINSMGQTVSKLNIDRIDAAPIQIGLNQVDAGFYYLQVVVNGELVDLQKVIVEKR